MGFDTVYKLSVVMQMIDNLSQPMKGISSKMDSSLSSFDRMSQGFGTITQTGAAMAGVGGQITEGIMKPIEATFETKRAIGELASLGVQDLGLLEDAAAQFSNKWAGTSKAEFITAAYDIKSGIASLSDEGIAQYTELAGVTATATKSTIAEMTDLFASGYGIYKDFYGDLSDLEFGEMFSAGISESVKAFKTSGSGMAESIKTLGASATTAQVPLEEQLSILGMLQATMSGSEAGTKYKAFLRSAAKGGQELGLDFLDANNQLLSMPEILEQLRGKFGDTMDAAEKMQLQKAFGDTEAVALIDLMYNKTGDLQNNILSLYDSMASGKGAATQMADAINQTDPSKYELLKQKIHGVVEEVGGSLDPVIGGYMDKAGEMIGKIGGWVTSHQELVRVLMSVGLAFGLLLLTMGTASSVIGGIGMIFSRSGALLTGFGKALFSIPGHLETIYIKALYAKDGIVKIGGAIGTFGKSLITSGAQAVRGFVTSLVSMARQAVTTAATALPGLISSVWSFTAALLANPITWVVIGIVALIAAIILLWNKCEWFRNGVQAIFSFITSGVAAALGAAKAAFSAISNVIGNVMTAARQTVSQNLNNMKEAYTQHGGGIRGIAAAAMEGVKGYYTAGFTFLDNLTGGKLSALKDKFSTGIQGIKDKILSIDFKESGKKIMETFAAGIKAAISAPVDAIKGGLQKIRNMLPFSDAKTGPLSKLTLSGRKVMTTFAGGIKQEENLPTETVQKSFESMEFSVVDRVPEPKKEKKKEEVSGDGPERTGGKRFTINHLHLEVDIKKIKDLQKLFQLMEEIEDYTNGNGPNTEPEPQPQPV
ncbi:hypothetical protein K070079E91_44950 [Eisenbergiella porci]|uniref:phage tail tape measure protein n=1 Tax=Eisenbergiella porci TaxID=2652274 RepID=UPI0036F3D5CF